VFCVDPLLAAYADYFQGVSVLKYGWTGLGYGLELVPLSYVKKEVAFIIMLEGN
jgi:hypothetical protein